MIIYLLSFHRTHIAFGNRFFIDLSVTPSKTLCGSFRSPAYTDSVKIFALHAHTDALVSYSIGPTVHNVHTRSLCIFCFVIPRGVIVYSQSSSLHLRIQQRIILFSLRSLILCSSFIVSLCALQRNDRSFGTPSNVIKDACTYVLTVLFTSHNHVSNILSFTVTIRPVF